MTGDVYQKLVAKTMPNPEDKIASGLHGVLGLICKKPEYLEAVDNLRQSFRYGNNEFQSCKKRVLKEAGDMWWFVAEIATANDLSLSEIIGLRVFFPDSIDPYVIIAEIYKGYFQGFKINAETIAPLLHYITRLLLLNIDGYGISVEDIWEFNIKELEKN